MLKIALRTGSVLFLCCGEVIAIFVRALFSRAELGHGTVVVLCAARLPRLLERLGGAFPKVGQILGTRSDLLPSEVCRGLERLQDNTTPLPDDLVTRLLQESGLSEYVCEFDLRPAASATIAQVHRAVRKDDGRVVALKILRPGTRRMLEIDCQIAKLVAGVLALLPQMRGVPVREAITETCGVLLGQTDFRQEAANIDRLSRAFSSTPEVQVPGLHRDLCGPDVLVMDFIDGMMKLSDPRIPQATAQSVLTVGVCALFRMIFLEGFLHCDLHPGNMLMGRDGRLVILDAGFVAELNEASRRSFAEFFLSIALRDGAAAARIVRETARHLPDSLDGDKFDREIAGLIDRAGGLRARDFQVAAFVAELFSIQRRHKVHGTSQFTLPIVSLLVIEGVAKQRHPDLDFQGESVPFVMAALSRKAGAASLGHP